MRSNLAVAALLLALAGYVFIAAGALPFGTARVPQTAFFPKTLAVLLAIFALVLMGQALAGRSEPMASQKITAEGWVRIGGTLAALILFAVILETLGFLATTFLLMALLLRALEAQPWLKVAGIALAAAIVSYALFAWVLGVPLPAGFLGL